MYLVLLRKMPLKKTCEGDVNLELKFEVREDERGVRPGLLGYESYCWVDKLKDFRLSD